MSSEEVRPPAPAEAAEAQRRDGRRIYVASLSDYNAGILHGVWLEATDTVEGLQDGIDAMLAMSPNQKRTGELAEEWAIHDFDGWGPLRLGEYESLERVAKLASGIAEHGEAFAAYADMLGQAEEDELSEFEERYLGEFSSLEEFAESMLDDMGFDIDDLPGIPEQLRPYIAIDVAGWARDMEMGGDIASMESATGVYIFYSR